MSDFIRFLVLNHYPTNKNAPQTKIEGMFAAQTYFIRSRIHKKKALHFMKGFEGRSLEDRMIEKRSREIILPPLPA